MPGIFGGQDIGHHRLGRQPALDQPFRRGCLDHGLFAGAAGVFGTVCDDHAELRRDHVKPLGLLFTDHMHGRLAAWTVRIFRSDRYVHARQMKRQRPAIGVARLGTRLCRLHVLLVVAGLAFGNCLFDILERQKQLVAIKLLRTPAKLSAAQLAKQMAQAIDLRERAVALANGGIALCHRSVALHPRRHHQRMQSLGIRRKLICDFAHAMHRI